MFPHIPPEKTAPLDRSNYFSLVLVPEAALLLIEEDLQKKSDNEGVKVGRTKALKVLRKSHNYGLAMFPFQEGEDGDTGDIIIRERAKKMRKITEYEEKKGSKDQDDNENVIDLSSDSSAPARPKRQKPNSTRQNKIEPARLGHAKSSGYKDLSVNKERNSLEDSKLVKLEQKDNAKRRRRILESNAANTGFTIKDDGPGRHKTSRATTSRVPSTSRSNFDWLLDA
jgi:hypothetical protein